jgi:hypothetical protein
MLQINERLYFILRVVRSDFTIAATTLFKSISDSSSTFKNQNILTESSLTDFAVRSNSLRDGSYAIEEEILDDDFILEDELDRLCLC